MLLRDLVLCRHDSMTQLLQFCQLNIYDLNLLFPPLLKVVLRSCEYEGHLSTVKSLFQEPI